MGVDLDLVRVAESGRVSIPAKYRKRLGLDHGGTVAARIENGELRLRPVRQVVAELQDRVSRLTSAAGSGVEWLLEQRRREFAEEQSGIEGNAAHEHPGRERDHCPVGEGTGSPDSR